MKVGKLFYLTRPLALLAFVLPLIAQAESVRVVASDLLSPYLEAPLKAFDAMDGLDLKVEGMGSIPALDQIRDGDADLAIIAIPGDDAMPAGELKLYPFAFDASILAVSAMNPLNEISVEFLGGIFGSEEKNNFGRWGELGIPGWGNRNIKPVVATADESIAFELFKFHSIESGALRSSVAFVSEDEVEEMILSDAATICVLSRVPNSAGVKLLMVADSEGGPAYAPTEDNIYYGDYPIRLPFYIAFEPAKEELVRPLVRALLSQDVSDALKQAELFPLPDSIRENLLVDLDLE